MMKGLTAYAVLGDWIGWLCAILALLSIGRGYQLIRSRPERKQITDRKEKKLSKRPKKS
jgi:hypothetical protein